MRHRFAATVLFLLLSFGFVNGAEEVLLWTDVVPYAKGEAKTDLPALIAYPADAAKAAGCGVIICPGGRYGGLSMDHEGERVAQWMNERGISAWILRYRLGTYGYHHPVQQADVLRAIRLTRHRAAEWQIDPRRIGVMGFEAGGHLASVAATHFDDGDPFADDLVDRESSRPDFAVLCYPVISMEDALTHKGLRQNLLGEEEENHAELVEFLSSEKNVNRRTPPTFLFHTTEDTKAPAEHSLAFYAALRKAGVQNCELHIYQKGEHGVALASGDPFLSNWPDRLQDWLMVNKFLRENSSP